MPKWQIEPAEYLGRLHLSLEDFKERLRLPDVDKVKRIIPLRDMRNIQSLIPLTLEMVVFLLKRIMTQDGGKPFTNSNVRLVKMDPRHLKIGQRYVYREKYQNLLEQVPEIFHSFLVTNGGLADLSAYFVFGYDENGEYAMACYMPPMIEKHNSDLGVMDGIHRNYLIRQSGMTLNVLLIDNISLPFPCGLREWADVTVISQSDKPEELPMRYFDLDQGLFRDLKYLGIDG